MITAFDVYLLSRLDAVNVLLTVLLTITAFASFMTVIITFMETSDWRKHKQLFYTPIIPLVLAVLLVAIPTTKEACAIIAIPALANNQDVQEIGTEVVDLAKDWLQELKPPSPESR